eukprot:GHVS01085892.1.p1 GENE.GHVS01085892.1~~GHVS01085892.1.p1  ORF type:complete len:691 (+),score=74.80 GHVS01085892.1:382-2454(+)
MEMDVLHLTRNFPSMTFKTQNSEYDDTPIFAVASGGELHKQAGNLFKPRIASNPSKAYVVNRSGVAGLVMLFAAMALLPCSCYDAPIAFDEIMKLHQCQTGDIDKTMFTVSIGRNSRSTVKLDETTKTVMKSFKYKAYMYCRLEWCRVESIVRHLLGNTETARLYKEWLKTKGPRYDEWLVTNGHQAKDVTWDKISERLKKSLFLKEKFQIVLPHASKDNSLFMQYVKSPKLPDVNNLEYLAVELDKKLRWLNERGIIHGDVRPINVLVEEGTVYLIDFGCSCFTETAFASIEESEDNDERCVMEPCISTNNGKIATYNFTPVEQQDSLSPEIFSPSCSEDTDSFGFANTLTHLWLFKLFAKEKQRLETVLSTEGGDEVLQPVALSAQSVINVVLPLLHNDLDLENHDEGHKKMRGFVNQFAPLRGYSFLSYYSAGGYGRRLLGEDFVKQYGDSLLPYFFFATLPAHRPSLSRLFVLLEGMGKLPAVPADKMKPQIKDGGSATDVAVLRGTDAERMSRRRKHIAELMIEAFLPCIHQQPKISPFVDKAHETMTKHFTAIVNPRSGSLQNEIRNQTVTLLILSLPFRRPVIMGEIIEFIAKVVLVLGPRVLERTVLDSDTSLELTWGWKMKGNAKAVNKVRSLLGIDKLETERRKQVDDVLMSIKSDILESGLESGIWLDTADFITELMAV